MRILSKAVSLAGQVLALIAGDSQTTSVSNIRDQYQYHLNI